MKVQPGSTLIHNGQVIDGKSAPPVAHAASVMTDDLFTYASPSKDVPST